MGAYTQHDQQGFTIVETLMFMTISALLAVSLLGGWTVMINNQRYKDSVHTLQSFIQQQYNLVYNVENGRDTLTSCTYNPAAGYSFNDTTTGSQVPRGQSGCVVMGRYLYIENGSVVKVSSIIGLDQEEEKLKATYSEPDNDADSIKNYKPARADTPVGLTSNELAIPWQTNVVGINGDKNPKSYAIAIIRAPSTGTVHTYTSPVAVNVSPPEVTTMVDIQFERDDVNLCLNADAPLTTSGQGVIIKARSSSQSSIETIAGGVCA